MEAVQNVQQVNTAHKVVGIQGAGWVIIGCLVIALCIYYFLVRTLELLCRCKYCDERFANGLFGRS